MSFMNDPQAKDSAGPLQNRFYFLNVSDAQEVVITLGYLGFADVNGYFQIKSTLFVQVHIYEIINAHSCKPLRILCLILCKLFSLVL